MKTLLQFPPPRHPDDPPLETIYWSVFPDVAAHDTVAPDERRRRLPTVVIPREAMSELVFKQEETHGR